MGSLADGVHLHDDCYDVQFSCRREARSRRWTRTLCFTVVSPLIDVSALVAALEGPEGLLLADCRFDLAQLTWGTRVHAEATLPGAVHVDLDRDMSGPVPPKGESRAGGRHPLPALEAFRGRLKLWEIEPETRVVAFDHRGGPYAARLWWMLRAAGHGEVSVLDGGIDAWVHAGHELAPGRVPSAQAARPELELSEHAWPGTRDALSLVSQLELLCLFDARAAERFRGEVEPHDRFAGHIPNSRSLPFGGNLDEAGFFLAPDQLRSRFDALFAGIGPQHRVSYCGSGVTACHNLLAMEVAGLEAADLYPGSWSDWISDERRPREKGS